MNKTLKTLPVFLFITGLIAYVHAGYVIISVGGPAGENIFDPQTAIAMVGDDIIFDWVSGKHRVFESDAAKSCMKSVKPDAFTSEGFVFESPTKGIVHAKVAGKKWFFCSVASHCVGGMYGAIIINPVPPSPAPSTPTLPAPSPAPSTPTLLAPSPTPSTPALPTPSPAPSDPALSNGTISGVSTTGSSFPNNNTNNTPIMVGAIIGALIGGSVLTIGSFLLYKKFKNLRIIIISSENNRSNYVPRQIPDNRNNYNPRQIPESENQIHNDTEAYNYGQEVIPENNDNNSILRNYIIQVVRQEMMQNQSK